MEGDALFVLRRLRMCKKILLLIIFHSNGPRCKKVFKDGKICTEKTAMDMEIISAHAFACFSICD
jgi:hypothetical protein